MVRDIIVVLHKLFCAHLVSLICIAIAKMEDGSSDVVSVYIYNGVDEVPENVTHVRVDKTVTNILYRAFKNRQLLEVVELPEGLIRIENNAFQYCKSLNRVNIPSTVVEIGNNAFEGCKKLDRIVLPRGLQILGRAFDGCKSLKTINIPSGIEEIEEGMFFGCNRLIDITFSEGLKVIGEDAFTICDSLQSVNLPSSLKVIGEMAFEYCSELNSIQIHDNVEAIQSRAFNGCKLVSLRIPPLVTEFNVGIVAQNNYMVSIELSENITKVRVGRGNTCMRTNSLRNIALPHECTIVDNDIWRSRKDLEAAFSDANDENNDETILDALRHRFDDLPIHKICYYQSYHDNETTMQHLKREINSWTSNPPGPLNTTGKQQDCLGMTPLHILSCSTKPTIEMYRLLIDTYPETLIMKDKWGDVPLLYAIWCNAPSEVIDLFVESYKSLHLNYEFDWSGMIQTLTKRYASLLNIQMLISTLQKNFPHREYDLQQVVIELATWDTSQARLQEQYTSLETFKYLLGASITKRLDSLSVEKWRKDLENYIDGLSKDAEGREEDTRAVYDQLANYESVKEGTSILELALWKTKIDESRNKRARIDADVSYKEQCRINSGADIVIRNVLSYLLPLPEMDHSSECSSDESSEDW